MSPDLSPLVLPPDLHEDAVLADINADLPAGVDWKEGAVTYLRELVVDGGEQAEWFHLTKPFLGGPDFGPFWVDVFNFLDVVKRADLGVQSRVLDVGCGPGWTIQWLCKLGHDVIGLDISAELIDIAERRMASDPYPPFVGQPFRYDLRVHDIEAESLGLEKKVDLALFESTLHHFFNPVAALRNVAADLAEDGVVAVIEAAAPPRGSSWHTQNVELMERYHTIERPYTREQLQDILQLAGLTHAAFMRPVNGLFPQEAEGINPLVYELTRADNLNIFFAASSAAGIERLGVEARPLSVARTGWVPIDGTSFIETRPDGGRFRWCGPRVLIRLEGPGPHTLKLATTGLAPGQVQTVRVVSGGRLGGAVTLTAEAPATALELRGRAGQLVELHGDRTFSPCWWGDADPRLLSFTLDEA